MAKRKPKHALKKILPNERIDSDLHLPMLIIFEYFHAFD